MVGLMTSPGHTVNVIHSRDLRFRLTTEGSTVTVTCLPDCSLTVSIRLQSC